jgi:hypothetical protein
MREYLKDKIIELATNRTKTSETCIEEYSNLRRVIKLQVT